MSTVHCPHKNAKGVVPSPRLFGGRQVSGPAGPSEFPAPIMVFLPTSYDELLESWSPIYTRVPIGMYTSRQTRTFISIYVTCLSQNYGVEAIEQHDAGKYDMQTDLLSNCPPPVRSTAIISGYKISTRSPAVSPHPLLHNTMSGPSIKLNNGANIPAIGLGEYSPLYVTLSLRH